MVGPPSGLPSAPTEAHGSRRLVRLGLPRHLGQGHAAGAGGVEGGVNAAVAGATLGEGVLLWLQGVQGVQPAVVAVAAGCVAGERVAAGVTGVRRLPLEGERSLSSQTPQPGRGPHLLASSPHLSSGSLTSWPWYLG